MSEVQENQLMKASQFNRGVEDWTRCVRGESVSILQRTKGSGRLARELTARHLNDREGGRPTLDWASGSGDTAPIASTVQDEDTLSKMA